MRTVSAMVYGGRGGRLCARSVSCILTKYKATRPNAAIDVNVRNKRFLSSLSSFLPQLAVLQVLV